MEQTQIYDFIGKNHDPVFNKILSLTSGQAIHLGHISISLNLKGFYELESTDYHECFKSQNELYNGISKLFSEIELYAGGRYNG